MQRHYVASTLIRRCINVMCPLKYITKKKKKEKEKWEYKLKKQQLYFLIFNSLRNVICLHVYEN